MCQASHLQGGHSSSWSSSENTHMCIDTHAHTHKHTHTHTTAGPLGSAHSEGGHSSSWSSSDHDRGGAAAAAAGMQVTECDCDLPYLDLVGILHTAELV
jgi:hypothetical protein